MRRNILIVLVIALAMVGLVAWWWMTASDYDRAWTIIMLLPAIFTIGGPIALLLLLWLCLIVWRFVCWSYRKSRGKATA